MTKEDEEDERPQKHAHSDTKADELHHFATQEVSKVKKSGAVTKLKTKQAVTDDQKRKTKEVAKKAEIEEAANSEINVKSNKKRGRKSKLNTEEMPSNQNTLTSFTKVAQPAVKSCLTSEMTLEQILGKLGILDCLEKFQEQKVTGENLKYLTMDDLKGMGIPIGPARQITIECGNMLEAQKANSRPNANNLERFSCSPKFSPAHKDTVKTTVILPKKKRGAPKIKPEETADEKKIRLRESRKKKREEKLIEKDRQTDLEVSEKIKRQAESFAAGNNQTSVKINEFLAQKEGEATSQPKLLPEEEQHIVSAELKALTAAKPVHRNPLEDPAGGSSQDSMNSDEPFL